MPMDTGVETQSHESILWLEHMPHEPTRTQGLVPTHRAGLSRRQLSSALNEKAWMGCGIGDPSGAVVFMLW